ncbi:unnamed protein product [Dovyalis caffra]|uniref:Uncharacterized protein n=1 Tax=Dovyalis caffra TaxID=77055 RepID=A0AAV1S8M4_9ROSI|nr:unnamed protein product [Dovyalis caffra]
MRIPTKVGLISTLRNIDIVVIHAVQKRASNMRSLEEEDLVTKLNSLNIIVISCKGKVGIGEPSPMMAYARSLHDAKLKSQALHRLA